MRIKIPLIRKLRCKPIQDIVLVPDSGMWQMVIDAAEETAKVSLTESQAFKVGYIKSFAQEMKEKYESDSNQ